MSDVNAQELEHEANKLKIKVKSLEARLNGIERINELINFNGQFDVVADEVMSLILKLVDAEYILIILIDKETKEMQFKLNNLEWKKEEKKEKEELLNDKKSKFSEEMLDEIYKKDALIITEKVTADMRFESVVENCMGFLIRNLVSIPIKIKDDKIGVIEIFNKKPLGVSFSKADVELINSLSNGIGIVFNNAKLFDNFDKKVVELNSLVKAIEVINSTLELKLLLDVIMQLALRMMHSEAASVLLIDDEKCQLYFESAQGEKGDRIERKYLNKGEGIAGWVVQTGQAVLVPDVRKDARFSKKIDNFSGFKTKSILCVPLKVLDKIIGVAEVLNKKGTGSFDHEDLILFRSLASQAALAIEKVKLNQKLNHLFISTVKSLAAAIDAKHPYTRGHSERVGKYAMIIARELDFPDEYKKKLQLACMLHDLGKIGVSETVLEKEGNFSKEDWLAMKKHPVIGAEIIEPIEELKQFLPIIRHHHERFDGEGYPDGLKGDGIPFLSRIIAVADAFDSITSERPYRRKRPDDVALMEIKNNIGTQFDEKYAEAFITGYKREFLIRK